MTSTSVTDIIVPEEDELVEGRSPFQDAMREFRRNKLAVLSLAFIILEILVALFSPVFAPYHYAYQNNLEGWARPMTGYTVTTDQIDKCHWADTPIEWGCTIFFTGSDSLGRDLWSRTLYGSRVSLAIAFIAAAVIFAIGLVYGTISGFLGGTTDNIMMRIVDFMYSIPTLPLLILITVYFNALKRANVSTGFAGWLINVDQKMGGLLFVFLVIGALSWIGLARLARGQVLSYKRKEFIEAAHALGAKDSRIIFKHLIPNIIGPMIIAISLGIPGFIFTEAALSFIGLGVNPPTPSWGALINEGKQGLISRSYLVLVPGMALVLTTLAFNFVGDGLRDAFDPRLRGKK